MADETPKTVFVSTLGCRQNHFDSEALIQLAHQKGYTSTQDPKKADLHIVNTCAITHEADADSRKLTRRAVKNNPNAKVIVTGCYANADSSALNKIDGVHKIIGNENKANLFKFIQSEINPLPQKFATDRRPSHEQQFSEIKLTQVISKAKALKAPFIEPSYSPQHTRGFLKVQDGCDYRCTFCIVPSVRGPSRSLDPKLLVNQMLKMVDNAIPEINLTGVHIGTYGQDLPSKTNISTLVALLCEKLKESNQTKPLAQHTRLRLGSLDPHEVDNDLVNLFIKYPNELAPYLHLPIQSGDDMILSKMRRAHRIAPFIERVQYIKNLIPEFCIGSDVIVGFPGEDETSFAKTLSVLEKLPISYLHVFSYSHRSGTKAASFNDQITKSVKKQRNAQLRLLSQDKMRLLEDYIIDNQLLIPVLALKNTGDSKIIQGISHNYIKGSFNTATSEKISSSQWYLCNLERENLHKSIIFHPKSS